MASTGMGEKGFVGIERGCTGRPGYRMQAPWVAMDGLAFGNRHTAEVSQLLGREVVIHGRRDDLVREVILLRGLGGWGRFQHHGQTTGAGCHVPLT